MSLDDDFERPFEEFEPLQWGALRELCHANKDYFSTHQDENGSKIRASLLAILDHLEKMQPLYKEISKFAPMFDFDEQTPGNGYRSFLLLVDRGIMHSVTVCRQMYCQKDSFLFRKSYYMREVEACSQLLASLYTCLQFLKTLFSWSDQTKDGKLSLFSSNEHSPQELLNQTEIVNQYCFYGRCLGFQFGDNIKNILRTISVCLASFSEIYYSNGTLFGRWTNSLKYVMDPEARARRIIHVSQHADVSFCQSFWFLNETEILCSSVSMVVPLSINQVISIPPEELTLDTLDGGKISIPIPNSHIGRKPIHVRLLSAVRRVGMVGSAGTGGELLGLSESLIIHSHGGGFVSQTSRSHESYLRTWAVKLGVPILSIDYSLAPEAPFPRALEEILYAYAWSLNHASTLLGSTAQKVILIGDSAGANLNLGMTLKCLQMNIRKPDGIFMAYTPILIEFVTSPSRLLSLTDLLLPFGFMMRCLKAYTGSREKSQNGDEVVKSETESFAEVSESDLIALALSPNGDETNDAHKLASLPSDSTLNSVSLADVDDDGPPNNGKAWSFFGWPIGGDKREVRELDMERAKSPSEEFAFTVPKDPFLSPYLASDDILARFPPVKILTMELDPCLDDCVMFARKLKLLGNLVTLDILSGLPHGFLNLAPISKEAYEGSEVCIKRILELLQL
ncbi:PREDICTED: hormone-sensitive lipase isoform X2 [Polistes dominula]|uniref:Hormone-sensitive lipase isoform X2 n=1 Tax=Polistes dominula TaxID=743375 RepID=A0ABM1IK63_POLDO|nr:PREDICTED: hormone-sensitive lipase isoform X2 [Polistes dominula]